MRFEIKAGEVVESMFIDAPYDTKQDALDAIRQGVIEYTKDMMEPICGLSDGELDALADSY